MNIIDTIKKLQKLKRTFFTTPGHSLGKVIPSKIKKLIGEKVFNADFSEIDGLDVLSNPTGCILHSQKKTTQIYDTKASFYLVNGSTSGILAIMLAILKENDKVLVARNCHISVYNGLILTGAYPVWFMGKYDKNFGIFKGITLEDVKNAYIDGVKAIIITSPTYCGLCSKIEEISAFCKEKNIFFIVDEAHGALLNFSNKLPHSAIELGADICVQSLHKNSLALTGGAILHIAKNSSIKPSDIQSALNIINSTSPSFLLLSSIEEAINYLDSKKGRKKLDNLIENINEFKQNCKNVEFLQNDDITKLVFKINGLSGNKLSEILSNHNIEEEFSTNSSVICITNLGTSKKDLNKLKKVLNEVKIKEVKENEKVSFLLPKQIVSPKTAHNMEYEYIEKEKSIGKISGELIIPYPPGIPLLVEGELIEKTHIKYFSNDKIKVIKGDF